MLPASGNPISMSQINTEFLRSSSAAIQLKKAEDGDYGTLNHGFVGNESAPHSMSEFYSYQHLNFPQGGSIVDLWDARIGADGSNWESVYGNDTNMSVSGATYSSSAPNNFFFDGTNDQVSTDDSVTLGTGWTIAIWLRHTGGQGSSHERIFGMSGYQFEFAEDTGDKTKVYDGGNWASIDPVIDGGWQHIVFTFTDGSPKQLKVYEDSTLLNTYDEGREIPDDSITLGAKEGNGENWSGEIGQFILWNRVLSSGEISSLWGYDKGYYDE